jgi:phosphate:Na+ symporter
MNLALVVDISQSSWLSSTIVLLGGLGLFLIGIKELTDALKRLASDRLRAALEKLTRNRVSGALTGAGVTAVLQSSSLTTVLAIGFVSAGVMNSTQAISVVVGANVGTTITAQVISLQLTTAAFALVALGALGTLAMRNERRIPQAAVLLGLGLVFVGMQIMTAAVQPLRDSEFALSLFQRLDTVVLAILLGAIFCALVQSSSATTAIAITLASQNILSLEAGVAIIVGANIGTCVTALVATIGRSRAAMRVAAAHIAINIFGALIWALFIGQLADIARSISDTDVARQLANAHTIFNVSVAVVVLPLLTPLTRAIDRLIPDKATNGNENPLDNILLATPALALVATRKEISRLVAYCAQSVRAAAFIVHSSSEDAPLLLEHIDDPIDERHLALTNHLTEIGREPLSENQTAELFVLLATIDDLENIGDVIEVNLGRVAQHRLTSNLLIDRSSVEYINDISERVAQKLDILVTVLDTGPTPQTQTSTVAEPLEQMLKRRFEERMNMLRFNGNTTVDNVTFEREVLDNFERIYFYADRSLVELCALSDLHFHNGFESTP